MWKAVYTYKHWHISRLSPIFWCVSAKLKALMFSSQLSNGFIYLEPSCHRTGHAENCHISHACRGEGREGGKSTGFQKAERGIEASKYTVGKAKAALCSLFVWWVLVPLLTGSISRLSSKQGKCPPCLTAPVLSNWKLCVPLKQEVGLSARDRASILHLLLVFNLEVYQFSGFTLQSWNLCIYTLLN